MIDNHFQMMINKDPPNLTLPAIGQNILPKQFGDVNIKVKLLTDQGEILEIF